jgi:SAM-dependent methyltransferase
MYPKINPSFASAFVGWHGIFIFFLNYVYVDGWIGWMDWMNGWMDVGQVSRALAPYVAQLVGVDISPRMVEVYNTRANTQGLEPHEMRAVNSLAELHQEQCFDLAVCSMAYHHFASVEQITRELVTYLKPRGTLAVADIARMPGDTEEAAAPPVIPAQYEHIVAHTRGFAEEEMRALFEGPGGLENFSFELFTSAKREGRDIHFFLATGTKPAQSQ